MVDEKYLLSSLSEQVIGCAMRVHSTLGNGFPEIIYQRALAIELELCGISFTRESTQAVYYRDTCIGSRIVDFLVQEKLLIELKAIAELNDSHFSQIINYLTAFKLEVGLLINFGQKSLQYRRFIKTKA
ncbi:GxxExxY protein [Hymenobacter sp. PAMC 26628]|uniref:GxxExxY protein n=1 Tax=Hymenobacter sp. PAMC 26628 TaxID=1484118 RepID=UPI00076FFAA1|nr:GxxExxY protein [Hymenobacter sp. PAMC 26628]AMJ64953.1 GxxExxY protein [Hymenobacter sp. PAMC 26628]